MIKYFNNPVERDRFADLARQDFARAMENCPEYSSRYQKINFNLGNIFYYSSDIRTQEQTAKEGQEDGLTSVDVNRESLLKAKKYYTRAYNNMTNLPSDDSHFSVSDRVRLAYNLSYIYLKHGEYKDCFETLLQYERFERNNPNINLMLGTALLHVDQPAMAESHLSVSLYEDERQVETFNRIRPDFSYHRELFSRLSTTCNNLGVSYEKRKMLKEALMYYAKALNYAMQIDKTNPFAVSNKTRLLNDKGFVAPLIDDSISKYHRYSNDKGITTPRW
jgi:tetratricopeptide (TPR) repeat protein